jgi:prepilin-type N-terminal cleavage/methylation domain-containing protein
MRKNARGFTVIEIIFVIVILAAATMIFFVQKNNVSITARDAQRKTAINSIYYSLEEVYYKNAGYYPKTVDETILPSVDPAIFTDPSGAKIGTNNSNFHYEPLNCTDSHCKAYTLRTTLENEADFVKQSQHN